MAKPLARVVDPKALDAEDASAAVLEIEVPASWLAEACAIELEVPALLRCSPCAGGGCDGCERSGAFRTPEGERVLTVHLPGDVDGGAMIRLARPFDDADPGQLLVKVQAADVPSRGVTRRRPVVPPADEPFLDDEPGPLVAPIEPGRGALVAVAIALLVLLLAATQW